MAEYIKRETLLGRAEYDNNYRLIIPAEAIKTAPAADVTPVVRCKDCKHLVAVNVNGKGIPTCRMSGMEVAPAEFCSRGEKGRR